MLPPVSGAGASPETHGRTRVELRRAGTQVELRGGVKRGDSVILNPPVELVDGSKVRARSNTGELMRGAG
jgi:hypothetical protein